MLEFDPMKLDEAAGRAWLHKRSLEGEEGVRVFWDRIVKLVEILVGEGVKLESMEARIIADLGGTAEMKSLPRELRSETSDLAAGMIRQVVRGLSRE